VTLKCNQGGVSREGGAIWIGENPKYHYTESMKTSIDLPDDLYRRVKARSAMEGRSVREVATSLFQRWVESGQDASRGESGTGDTGESEVEGLDPGARAYLQRLDALARDLEAAGVTRMVEQLQADRR